MATLKDKTHSYNRTRLLLIKISILLILCAPVFALVAFKGNAAAPQIVMSVIDVGQGDSILVEFPNGQDMLVDAGPRSAGPDVVSYLKKRNISRINILVATHPHEDHIGGMQDVLASFPVDKVWDSGYSHGSRTQENFLQTIKDKGIRFGMPKAGFSQMVGDAQIEVLAPVRALSGTNSDANNNSVVLRISYKQTSFLLTGDMESEERSTVSSWPKTTVLKVAHHGSRNGTDKYFLSSLSPKMAIISCARGNSYGHPHASTLSALKDAGVKIYDTEDVGTVVLSSDGKNVTVKTLGASSHSSSYGQSGGNKSKEQPAPSGEGNYIGNKNSKIFHRPGCSSLPAEKNRVYFKTRDEAISQGYRPCKRCNP